MGRIISTSPNSRAETFYRKSRRTEIGDHGKGEIKFEMTFDLLIIISINCHLLPWLKNTVKQYILMIFILGELSNTSELALANKPNLTEISWNERSGQYGAKV